MAECAAFAEGFHAVEFDGIVEKTGEDAHRVAAAADAGGDDVRQVSRHFQDLFARLDADDVLEIPHHHRERMWADDRADAIDLVFRIADVGAKRGIHRFLEGFEAVGGGDHARAEDLHAGDVGRLLGDVHLAHVDVAFEAEVGGGGGERHAVHAGPGLGDEFLLAHVSREQALAHAVVELVRAGVVEVLALQVDLGLAEFFGKPGSVIGGCGPPLEMLADAPKLLDEIMRAGNHLVGLADLRKRSLQLRRHEDTSVISKETGRIGVLPEVAGWRAGSHGLRWV